MKDFTEVGLAVIEQVNGLKIVDEQDYMVAESLGKVISEEIKKIKAYFKPIKADANKAWKNIVNAEKESLIDPEKAKNILKISMLVYEEEQERIRQVEEKRLRDELYQQTVEIGYEPEGITPEDIIIQPTFQKQGQTRKNWKAEITDFKALVAWVNQSGNTQYLDPNVRELNDMARMVESVSTIPGVRFYNDPIKVF